MTRTFVEAEVVSRREVARDTYVIGYGLDFAGEVQAGQFAMVHTGDDDEYVLPRPYSILDVVDGRMDLLVKIAGRGSRHLVGLPEGTRVRVLAPLGTGFPVHEFVSRPSVLVAGGVGVVPLWRLAREVKRAGGSTLPLFGARTPIDLPMDLLGDDPAGPWELWVEQDAHDGLHTGLVTKGLELALDADPELMVATCGPTPMMHAVARICREREVPLWVCLEEQMGCGSGVCRACVIEDAHLPKMLTVCKEGPVFPLDAIRFLPEDRTAAIDASRGACPA